VIVPLFTVGKNVKEGTTDDCIDCRFVPSDEFYSRCAAGLFRKCEADLSVFQATRKNGSNVISIVSKTITIYKTDSKHTANPNPTPRPTKTHPNMSMHTG
jgi:hypothetical protein